MKTSIEVIVVMPIMSVSHVMTVEIAKTAATQEAM